MKLIDHMKDLTCRCLVRLAQTNNAPQGVHFFRPLVPDFHSQRYWTLSKGKVYSLVSSTLKTRSLSVDDCR